MKLAIGWNSVGRLLLGASVVVRTGLASMATTALPAAAAPGRTLLVSTTGSDFGTCVSAACRTLGYAISQASAHDTILLETGVYRESQNPPGTQNVVGTSLAGLKIASQSGDPSGTIIDATGVRNGIVVNADDVTIQSLTIRGAVSEGILESPPTNAVAPANVTGETVKDDIVEHDGGSIHLESTTNSTVTANTVEHNMGGILIASTPDGGGYWLVVSDGGVFSFGDAKFFGSAPGALKPGARLSAPIVGVAASPGAIDLGSGRFSGDGYWLVASDGGVFSFGDAGYFGSVPGALKPGAHLNAPIVGIAASPGVLDASTSDFDSDGYWLAGADGGMFAFGQARYVGSVPGPLKPGQHLAAPVVSIAGA